MTMKLLTIDFRVQQREWLDSLIQTASYSKPSRSDEVVVNAPEPSHSYSKLNRQRMSSAVLPLLQPDNVYAIAQSEANQYWQEDAEAVDLVLIANYGDVASLNPFIQQWRSQYLTRDSDIVIVDFSDDDRHEANELAALQAGVLDYWQSPFGTERISLKLQRVIQIRSERQQLENLSATDALTGVANRRSFERCLSTEWRRAVRECHGIGMLMIDIDHFKAFNDFYGHVDGDSCLRHVADLIKEQLLRPCDFLARFGGEEFVAILPNIRLNGLPHVANRIQHAIADANIAHAHSSHDHKLTVSIGLSWCEPNPNISQDALLRAADTALYNAKASGRNFVSDIVKVSASSPSAIPI